MFGVTKATAQEREARDAQDQKFIAELVEITLSKDYDWWEERATFLERVLSKARYRKIMSAHARKIQELRGW